MNRPASSSSELSPARPASVDALRVAAEVAVRQLAERMDCESFRRETDCPRCIALNALRSALEEAP